MAGNTFIGFLQQEATQKASNIQRRREDKVHHTGPINIIEPSFLHQKNRNMEKVTSMIAFVINIFPFLIPAGHKPSGPSGI